MLKELEQRDPSFTWKAFITRVERTFQEFHASWCAQDLTAVRPYLSDNLFELQRYWVHAYKSQGLKNQTKDASIVTVHLAKVMRDRFFDSITVRVFARCFDYTTDANGKIVGGSDKDLREYTEYWTFIRGVGAKGAPRTDGNCPSCGASLAGINMAGACTHCNAKVTSGEFDWVLSRIEQDEVYEAAA
jgi:predicted lipid-binding transport protein (Tim44 family)